MSSEPKISGELLYSGAKGISNGALERIKFASFRRLRGSLTYRDGTELVRHPRANGDFAKIAGFQEYH